ncbi:uncharacterized protein LOC121422223 isoform X1 [Lytechinus variegatus]|uniref:uncharacterized protein LOC121422223 isoform X1 n=2 Tax=Lytechinus variegatus TaxID=7654 RepID=UPI001BB1479B|nr:uncharacterized protein LOC121422223 isoform X1 [Lytechinus variegatus]
MCVITSFVVIFWSMMLYAPIKADFTVEGCYKVDVQNRIFVTSAGDYDPNAIDHKTCADTCGALEYQYAALTMGRYCLCSSDTYSGGAQTGTCDRPCGGDSAQFCGGSGSDTVLSITLTRAAVQLNSTNDVFVVGQPQSLQPDVTGEAVTTSFEYGDGSPATADDAVQTKNHVYALPGLYVASILAQNSYSSAFAGAQITTYMGITDVGMDCPEVVEPSTLFSCSITVTDGSDMTLTTNIGSPYHIGTPNIFSIGTVSQYALSTLQYDTVASDTVWILPGQEFLDNGAIRSVEVNVETTGTIHFLILEPFCSGAGEIYCLIDNQCSSSPCGYDTLMPTNPLYHASCDSSTHIFCLSEHRCASKSDESVCEAEPDRYVTSTGDASRASYRVRHVITQTATSTGYNYFEIPVADRTAIAEIGDVLGFAVDAGTAEVRYDTSDGAVAFSLTSSTPTAGMEFVSGLTAEAKQFHIRMAAIDPLSIVLEHEYPDVGTNTISVRVNNTLDSVGVTADSVVEVQIPIRNLMITVSPDQPYFSSEADISLTVSVDSGDPIDLDIDWGDGEILQLNRSSVLPVFGHFYNISNGQITITVTASNLHGNESTSETIYIQHPVLEEHYKIMPDTPASHPYPSPEQGYINITVELLASNGKPYGTDPNISFSGGYYDNSTHVMTLNNEGDQESYINPVQFPGTFYVTVTIENLVSSITIIEKVELYGVISPDIYLKVLYQPEIPPDGSPIADYGNNYPLERPIVFEPVYSSGTNITFEYLDFGDAGSVPENTTESTLVHHYSTPGEHTVTVAASNPVSERYFITATFQLFRTIHSIEVTTGDITIPNQPKNFSITIGQIGYNSCLAIDYGDHQTPIMYGEAVCDGHWKSPFADYIGPLTNTINLLHTYSDNGSFIFTVRGFNLVSDISIEEAFAVTYLECNVPAVSFSDAHPYATYPRLVETFNFIALKTETDIRCKIHDNIKSWSVSEYNSTNGELISGLSVNLTELEPTDQFYIGEANTADIKLNPYTYPPGHYCITYCVAMDSSKLDGVVFRACAREYIRVLPFNLEARVVDGQLSSTTVGHGQIFTLDPGRYSYDPSIDRDSDQGITVFKYYCKRFYEEFRLDINKNLVDTPVEITSDGGLDGGCFGTGPGRLNHDQSILNLDTGLMNYNMTYDMTVVIEKGTVFGEVSFQLKIVSGNPPQPVIRLSDGTPSTSDFNAIKINPSDDLRLRSDCTADCDDVTYQWDMLFNNGTHVLPLTGWEGLATGITTDAVYIEHSAFKLQSSVVNYVIQLAATNVGGVVGITEIEAKLNTPPEGGQCDVDSRSIELGDSVYINCFDWQDEDGIFAYRFFAVDGDSRQLKIVVSTGQALVQLGVGSTNNTVGISVVIIDRYGAATDVDLGNVYVDPGRKAENILNENTVTDLLSSYSELEAEGSLVSVTVRTGIDISALNYDATVTNSRIDTEIETHSVNLGTENETVTELSSSAIRELEVQKLQKTSMRAYIRSQIVTVQAAMEVNNVEDAQILGASAVAVSLFTNELSQSALTSLNTVADKILDVTEEQKDTLSSDSLATTVSLLFEILGNTIEGSARSVQESLPLNDFELEGGDQSFSAFQSALSAATSVSDSEGSTTEWTQEKEENLQRKRDNGRVVVTAARSKIENSKKLLAANMLAREPAFHIKSDTITMTYQKHTCDMLTNEDVNEEFGSLTLPSTANLFSDPDAVCGVPISRTTISTRLNSYNWEESSDRISLNSGIMEVVLETLDGDPIPVSDTKEPVIIKVERKNGEEPGWTEITSESLVNVTNVTYHSFDILYNNTAFTVQIQAESESCYALLLGFSGFPNASSFDDIRVFRYDRDANATTDKVIYEAFYSNSVVGNNARKYYAMLLELDCVKLFNDYPDLSSSEDNQLLWAAGNTSQNFSMPYGFRILTSGCSYWDEADEMWHQDGCEVLSSTTYSEQYCSCNHLTSFASTWIVPPTPLDFNYILENASFTENLTIYITTIVVYVFFFFILLWARRRDRKDLLKLGVTPLTDNNPNHNYYYEIVVLTGQRKAAGTDSKVSFILSGENEETNVREFEDDKRKIFRRGASDRFLMAVPGPLGTLNYMRIWHDNSGKGKMQGWYVKYIAIRDIQTRERFYFIVNQWFSVVEDDGQIDRLIPVAGREQMQNFSHLFSNHSRKNFNDGHLWFSIIARPPGSRFTRFQRAACCLMFLWLEMLVNIMFYKVTPPPAATSPIEIGPLSLSPAQISIGIQANLIVFPVSLLVVQFFRKSRPRKMRESRIKLAALVNKPVRKLKRRPRKTAPADYSKLEDFASPSRIVLEESSKPAMMMNPTAGTRAEPSLVVPPIPGTYDESVAQGGRGAGYFGGDSSPTPQGTGDATVLIQPEKPKRRKKFSFPWWFVIIAWIVLILTLAAATTFTVFYGIQFGNKEASEWLCSIVVSFVFGIFLTQPIKILLVATFIACIIKSPNADEDTEMEEDEEEFDLRPDEEYLHTVSGTVSRKKRKLPYKPPDPEALERAREQRLKEIKMYSIFREIFFYVVYLWVVLVISYGNSDPSAYRMQEDFFNELVIGPDSVHSFTKINSHTSFWAYLHTTLVPTIFPQTWYNGDPSPELEGFLADQNALILGYPVLRQVRVKRGECEVVSEFTDIVPECNVAYSVTDSDEENYGPGWTPYNPNITDRPQYNYTAWDDIESYPVLGRHALYSGGGYLAKLQGNKTDVEALLDQLYQEAWLDRYTRGVFVEIALYNSQVDLFGVVSLLAEFLPTGGVEPFYRIDIIRLYTYAQGFGAVRLACEILFLGFIVFFIVREINNLRREGVKKYFKTFWNLAEWIIIACAIGATVVYFYRKYVTANLLEEFKATHGTERINLQYVAYWNELLTYLLGVVVFIGNLKFIKLLRFNKRIGILSSTIQSCTKDLIHFGIMFGIFFIAYALAFHQMYLRHLLDFSDFIFTMETLSAAMLGKFHYAGIAETNRILGPIFFFFFMITITFILVNMFLTIVIEAFSSVKRDITRQSNDYEMVDFMIGQLKKWVGWNNKTKPEDKKTNPVTEMDNHDPMTEFPDKVDQLLDCIAKVYFDASQFEDIIRGMGGSKGENTNTTKKRPVKIALTG